MTHKEIVHLQSALNRFVQDHKQLGHSALRVDGDWGRLTKKLFRDVQYDIGYLRENTLKVPDDNFFKRANHPNQVEPKWGQTRDAVKRGQRRRAERRKAVLRNRFRAYLKPGVGHFDGVPVAKTAIPVLEWCRAHDWHGTLVSGWRSGPYSESLCYRMCGRPSCPGKCAGRSTNHTGTGPDRFAMDVSDYIKFGEVVAECPIRPHVHNSLPNDRVHFSPQGN